MDEQAPISFEAIEQEMTAYLENLNTVISHPQMFIEAYHFLQARLTLHVNQRPSDICGAVFGRDDIYTNPTELTSMIARWRYVLNSLRICQMLALEAGVQQTPLDDEVLSLMVTFDGLVHLLYISISVRNLVEKNDFSTVPKQYSDIFAIPQLTYKAEKKEVLALILKFYMHCRIRNWKKVGEDIYEQIYTGSIPTRTWRRYKSIADVIHRPDTYCTTGTDKSILLVASAGQIAASLKIMSSLDMALLPEVAPDRHNFSFRNGIYFCQEDRFLPWDQVPRDRDLTCSKFFDLAFSTDTEWDCLPVYRHLCETTLETYQGRADTTEYLPKFEAILKRIDQFPHGNWREADVPIPEMDLENCEEDTVLRIFWTLQSVMKEFNLDILYLHPEAPNGVSVEPINTILETQEIPDEVQFWIWVMLGRMFYPLHAYDSWQIILFLKGLAGSGKSTLLEVILEFYSDDKVLLVSSNTEQVFGLQDAEKKFVWLATEVKSKFSFSQENFQNAVSGECINQPQKFKSAATFRWRLPGMLAGNDPLPYPDASRSIARRLMLVFFFNVVKHVNGGMRQEIRNSLDAILVKANKAYRLAARLYGNEDIHRVLPRYFDDTSKRYRAEIDPLTCFVMSNKLTRVTGGKISKEKFENLLRRFCEEHRFGKSVTLLTEQHITLLEWDFNVILRHGEYDDPMGGTMVGAYFENIQANE